MSALLAAALVVASLSHNAPELATHDRVDVCELNHFHDENGSRVFCQIIFWNWHHDDASHHVLAWRLTKDAVGFRLSRSHAFVDVFRDPPRLRKITAISYRESWSQHDPELLDRDERPCELRDGLTGQGNKVR